MKKHFWAYMLLFGIAGVVVALDQWTKFLVRTNLDFREIWSPWPWLTPYVRIVHWKNTGAAFGMFQNLNSVFIVLAILVSLAIIYYYPRVPREEWPLRIAMGFQLGGAVGNLIDRILQGYVTDYISMFSFAVFNVADASISFGVAVLVLGVWIKERNQKDPKTNASPGSEPSPEPSGDGAVEALHED
ncbi:MAG: signal peptidase II [Chloroflexota bacterium]|nr:MAG: signal peptidase II [Chloroflexota bacterium]